MTKFSHFIDLHRWKSQRRSLAARGMAMVLAGGLCLGAICPLSLHAMEDPSVNSVVSTVQKDQATQITKDAWIHPLPKEVDGIVSESGRLQEDFAFQTESSIRQWPVLRDLRQQVTDFALTGNRALCRLSLYFKDPSISELRRFAGSGFIVGKSSVLTSAHCLYDHEDHLGWVERIVLEVPNRDGTYSTYDSQIENVDVVIPEGYGLSADSALDLGMIRLNSPIGTWHGLLEASTDVHQGDTLLNAGYPKDLATPTQRPLYAASGPALDISQGEIAVGIYSSGGSSGSPFINLEGQAVGVLSYGAFLSGDGRQRASMGPCFNSQWIEWLSTNGDICSPVYRAYNPNSGEHVYTMSFGELVVLVQAGWRDEGLAWYSAQDEGKPVYRVYNPNAGDHHYTTSAAEVSHLESLGWKGEGPCWRVGSEDRTVYRLYNPNACTGTHHFTRNASEAAALQAAGWRSEGTLQ